MLLGGFLRQARLALGLFQGLAVAHGLGGGLTKPYAQALNLRRQECQRDAQAQRAAQQARERAYTSAQDTHTCIGRGSSGSKTTFGRHRGVEGSRALRGLPLQFPLGGIHALEGVTQLAPGLGIRSLGGGAGGRGSSVGRLGRRAGVDSDGIGTVRGRVGGRGHAVGLDRLGGRDRLGGPAGKPFGNLGDLHRAPDLARHRQRVDQNVEVAGQGVDDLGSVRAADQPLVGCAHIQGPLRGKILQGTAHGGRQLAVLARHDICLALQGLHDGFRRQGALPGHLPQLARGDVQTLGQRLRQARSLLHHAVEFFTAQHAGLQALDQLRQRGPGGLGRAARQLRGLIDGGGQPQRPLLRGGCSHAALLRGFGQAREQVAGFLQRAVGRQGHALHAAEGLLKQWAFTRGELDTGLKVLEFVGRRAYVLDQTTEVATANRQRGDLLDALQLRADR